LVRISVAMSVMLDHCATGTARQLNRVHPRIAFIDFLSISLLSIWWTAFHKIEIDSNGTFARLVAARANQPACHPRNPWLAFRPKIRVYSRLRSLRGFLERRKRLVDDNPGQFIFEPDRLLRRKRCRIVER